MSFFEKSNKNRKNSKKNSDQIGSNTQISKGSQVKEKHFDKDLRYDDLQLEEKMSLQGVNEISTLKSPRDETPSLHTFNLNKLTNKFNPPKNFSLPPEQVPASKGQGVNLSSSFFINPNQSINSIKEAGIPLEFHSCYGNYLQVDKEDTHRNNRGNEESSRVTKKSEPKKKLQVQFKLLTSVLPKMKKFIEKRTVYGRTKHLTNMIRMYIGDEADYVANRGGNSLTISLKKVISWICITLKLDKIPLFNPENQIKLIINTIIVAYNLFYLFLISVEVFFEAHLGEASQYLNSIAIFAWIFEMILQMNTACYHHNHFVTDRAIIMKIYLKEYFFFEILPLLFEGRKSTHPGINILLHLPLLLKIKGMMIILEKLEFYVLQILKKAYILQLFKLCMKVILLGHIIACSWYLVAKLEINFLSDENNWIHRMNEEKLGNKEGELHWVSYYLESLYWAFSEMMHNSAEKPQTNLELGYSSLTMLLSSILFVYLINSIGAILTDIDKQQEDYKKDLNLLNNFMKRKKIDLQIQFLFVSSFNYQMNRNLRRLANLNLLKHYQQLSKDNVIQEKEILQKLSGYMQRQLLIKANQKYVKKIPMIANIVSEDTLTKLYSIMEEEVYAPNQVIYSQSKSHFNDSIYLIIKGQVTLYVENESSCKPSFDTLNFPSSSITSTQEEESVNIGNSKKKEIQVLKEGQYFGNLSFLTGKNKTISIMSSKFTELIKIEREKFMEIIRENKDDFEKFMELKDKVLFDSNLRKAEGLVCRACNSQDHVLKDCDKIYFDRKNPFIIYKHNQTEYQERNNIIGRKTYFKINSRLKQKVVHQMAVKCQEENDLINSSEEDDIVEESVGYYDDLYYGNQYDEDFPKCQEDEEDKRSQKNRQKRVSLKDKKVGDFSENDNFLIEVLKKASTKRVSIENRRESSKFFTNNSNTLNDKKKDSFIFLPNNNCLCNQQNDKKKDSLNYLPNLNNGSCNQQIIRKSCSLSQFNDQTVGFEQSFGGLANDVCITSLERIEKENVNDSEFQYHVPQSPMTPMRARRFYSKAEDKSSIRESSPKKMKSYTNQISPIIVPKNHGKSSPKNSNLDDPTPKSNQQHIQNTKISFLCPVPNSPRTKGILTEGRRFSKGIENFPNIPLHDLQVQEENIKKMGYFQNNNYSSNLNNFGPPIETELFFWKFDKLQDYVYYYPLYNSVVILKKWNQLYHHNEKKKKKPTKVKSTKNIMPLK